MRPSDFARIHLASIGSTNDFAREKFGQGRLKAPALVTADVQTAGRGRGNNRWESGSDKGLWLTLCLPARSGQPFDTVVRASLSVLEALSGYGLRAAIKWPNDIVQGRKKLCGMLSEAGGSGLFLGIGINLRQGAEDFPAELRPVATSLFLETGVEPDNPDILDRLLDNFCVREDPERNFADYSANLGILGSRMEINGDRITVTGVERDGALSGIREDGQTKKYYSGSLRWLN